MRFRRRTTPREEELAALADGSLSRDRREPLESLVEQSPEFSALLLDQQRALATVRAVATSVEAPAALRTRIDAERRRRTLPARARRYAWAGAVATATASPPSSRSF